MLLLEILLLRAGVEPNPGPPTNLSGAAGGLDDISDVEDSKTPFAHSQTRGERERERER